ncbi:UNVERIFIED_CONTAM: hypothetical protein Sindi_1290200, partial [Sesamum indicum]
FVTVSRVRRVLYILSHCTVAALHPLLDLVLPPSLLTSTSASASPNIHRTLFLLRHFPQPTPPTRRSRHRREYKKSDMGLSRLDINPRISTGRCQQTVKRMVIVCHAFKPKHDF